jgi:hypothetical protein
MSKYPIITIPGDVVSKKNNPQLHCQKMPGKKKCGMLPRINDGIKQKKKEFIATEMRRCWGLPAISGPVNAKFTFYIPKFPNIPNIAGRDLSNSYQIYEDLMQANIASILENDSLIMGHDGSRFIFLCFSCCWGITGKRRSPIKNGKKVGCPGSKKCPDRRVEIEISDMVFNGRFYEIA